MISFVPLSVTITSHQHTCSPPLTCPLARPTHLLPSVASYLPNYFPAALIHFLIHLPHLPLTHSIIFNRTCLIHLPRLPAPLDFACLPPWDYTAFAFPYDLTPVLPLYPLFPYDFSYFSCLIVPQICFTYLPYLSIIGRLICLTNLLVYPSWPPHFSLTSLRLFCHLSYSTCFMDLHNFLTFLVAFLTCLTATFTFL